MPTDGPNVLLVVLDTARADSFTPYGAPGDPTPTVAQLAARGAAVHDAFAPCNWTMPSHASLFSGLLPRTIGLSKPPGGQAASCRPVIESRLDRWLPAVLAREGYATAAVSCNPWISHKPGFSTGFDDFTRVTSGRKQRIEATTWPGRLGWALEAVRGRVDEGAAEAATMVDRWLAAGPRQPFFWFVNLVECHSPYLPPARYNDLGPVQRWKAANEARCHLTIDGIWRACAGDFDIAPDAIDRMRHLYVRSITSMDDWLARVLEQLDAVGVLDDTVVVVTSDHGENLGEGELIGHAFSLDDRLLRVPLVAAGPGVAPPPGGAFSLAGLPRFIADTIGLGDHPWADDAFPTTAAVAETEALLDPSDPRLAEVRERWSLDPEGVRRLTEPITAATDGRYKLVRRAGDEVVFDLHADPLEVQGTPAAAVTVDIAHLRAALADADRSVRPPPGPGAGDDEIGALEDQLRLLGYI